MTIVYSGEVEHRDSTGRGGVIGPGDVQWMTAGAGFCMKSSTPTPLPVRVANWKWCSCGVNLPMKDKMTTPGYQSINHDVIPTVTLPDDAGTVRIIAGRYEETKGPAHTFSPLNVWDMRLQRNRQLTLSPVGRMEYRAGGTERHITVTARRRSTKRNWLVLSQQGKRCTLRPAATPAYCCYQASR
ncbi:pirin-like protein [Salmonella enterica subsp. arizonae]|uniref:Pirin-like protein n=1 Tax=Salmonella enterica subsp. arizonae TaxID=59203 RepID=A0A3S4G3I2_SALER|nr:pirin-like protein [Salmonella enterica subsp. arizonae]